MSKYDEDFKISKNAYRELYYFCLRYHEFKDKISEIILSGGGGHFTHSPSKGRYSDPTANKALKREKAEELTKLCELIEQTAIEVSSDNNIYEPILHNVTTGISYEQLRACGIIKKDGKGRICGKDRFYNIRRKFFCLLDYKRNNSLYS